MDADDTFTSKKLSIINKLFKNNKFKSIYNLPFSASRNFKIKYKNYDVWPTILPTSCISLKRHNFKKFLDHVEINQYPKLEIDARIVIFYKYFFGEYNLIKKKLSYYNYDPKGIMSKKKKFSPNWWISRYQAFCYLEKILKLKKRKLKLSFDKILTVLFLKYLIFLFK